MLLDIQGSGYTLYDPEIATRELRDDEDDNGNVGEMYFCAGNLTFMAIEAFCHSHKCSKFCEM